MSNAGIKPWWNYKSFTLKGDATHRLAVNTGNGNLVVSVTDFVFASRIPAVLMRTNNSSNYLVDGLLGKGWMLGWEENTRPGTMGSIIYTDPTGAEYTYTFSGGTYHKPAGTFSELTRDTGAGEFVLTAPDGFVRRFDQTTGKLKHLIDSNGNQLDFTWDGSGLLQGISSPDSGTPTAIVNHFIYDGYNHLTECGLDNGGTDHDVIFQYHYDGTGVFMDSATDPAGQVWQYASPSLPNPISNFTDPRGNLTVVAYSSGKVSSITDASPGISPPHIDFAYATVSGNPTTTITDRNTNNTVITHDPTNLYPTKIVLPGLTSPDDKVQLHFNSDLLLDIVTDPLGNATNYTYDSVGNVLTVTDADSHVTTYTYDSTYHSLLTVTTERSGDDHTTEFYYGSSGTDKAKRNVLRITNPITAEKTYFEYDADGHGDCIKTTDPSGHITTRTYDPVYGVCTSVSALLDSGKVPLTALTTTFEYEEAALWLLSTTNPEELVVTYERDAIGRTRYVNRIFTGVTPEKKITVQYQYDACGNVTTYTDPNSQDTTYAYNNLNLLESVKLPETASTNSTEYAYDHEENLASVKRYIDVSTYVETTYAYDELNRLKQVTLPAVDLEGEGSPIAAEIHYAYDAASRCTRKAVQRWTGTGSDAWICTDYEYKNNNLLYRETGPFYAAHWDADVPANAGVPQLEYAYNTDNTLATLKGRPVLTSPPPDRTYSYAYDDDSRLISVTAPDTTFPTADGGITEYEYYANSQLYRMRLPRQQAANGPYSRTYTYDSVGRVSTIADALGCMQRFTYLADGRLATMTDPANCQTSYSYDAVGRLLKTTFELDAWTQNNYFATGDRLETVTGPNNYKLTYAYDNRGRITSAAQNVEGESPLTTSYSYDQLDRMLTVIDPRGSQNTYTYDKQSRLIEAMLDDDHDGYTGFKYQFDFDYDLLGRLIKRTNPLEQDGMSRGEQLYAYDASSRVTSMTDPEGFESTAVYDDWGMLQKNSFADGGFSAYTYDELGRQLTQTNALSEDYTFEYDLNGNNTKLIAPYGATTEFSYNQRDELIKTVSYPTGGSPDGPDAKIELFDYNGAGQLSTYTGPGNEVWTFGYDQQGRWYKAGNSLGRACSRGYNENNCITDIHDLQSRHYALEYDSVNRRTSSTYNPGGADEAQTLFHWSGMDLDLVTEPDRTTAFERDRLGRITSSTLTVGMDDPLETLYDSYTWRSQLEQRTLPAYVDGYSEVEHYAYDKRGKLTKTTYDSTSHSVDIRYDQCGRQAGMTFPNGAQRSLTYNLAGRLISDSITSKNISGLTNAWQTLYGYDQAGNRIAQTRDRAFTSAGETIMPFWVPQDRYGNPVVPGEEITPTSGDRQWTGIPINGDAAPEPLTLTWGVPAPDSESLSAADGGGITSSATSHFDGTSTSMTASFIGTTLPAYPDVDGHHYLQPAWMVGLLEPQIERRSQDPLYNLLAVNSDPPLQTGSGNTAGQDQDNQNTGLNFNGQPLVANEARRAEVTTQVAFDATQQGQQHGTVPPLPAPWNLTTGSHGLSTLKIDTSKDLDDHMPRTFENEDAVKSTVVTYDNSTGQISTVSAGTTGSETTLGEFKYDQFGRRTQVTNHMASGGTVVSDLMRDWWSDELDFVKNGSSSGQGWAHAPGMSRLRNEDGTKEAFYARGPQGQMRWTLGSDGGLKTAYTYNAWGAQSGMRQMPVPGGGMGGDWPPGILPDYLDGDERVLLGGNNPAAGLPAWKQGAGAATDATPLVGLLAGPAESGGAGQGASGSPLTPGASASNNLNPDNPWDCDPGMSPPSIGRQFNPGTWTDPGFPANLPGHHSDKAPVGAPAAALDTSSIADNRLASLWSLPDLSGSSEYYGVKPGQQTGSPNYDDTRNQRLPLPGQGGSFGRGAIGVLPAYPPPQPHIPWPPSVIGQFPMPQVPNPDTGGGGKGGGAPAGSRLPHVCYLDGSANDVGGGDPDPAGDIGEDWGAFIGGDDGVIIGEAIGTLIEPGLGTLIGGLIGGYIGAHIGGAAGRAVGDAVNRASDGHVNNYLSNTTSGQILTKGLEAAPGIINELRMVGGAARDIDELTGRLGGSPGNGVLRNLAEDGEGNMAGRGLNTEGGALEENTGNVVESGSGGGKPIRGPLAKVPEWEISRSRNPDLAENIDNAMKAGHSDIATWHGDPDLSEANRKAALDGVPILKGKSRDEFPLASTEEGGAGAWVGHIPPDQNSSQGGLLRSFVKKNSIKPGDKFVIIIVD